MNIVDVLQCGFGSGLARIARACAGLDARDVELNKAVRLALEHLFKRDSEVRAKSLALAAVALQSLPSKKRPVGAEMVIDFLFAACRARTDRRDEAVAIVEGWREMLRPIVVTHRETARALECSSNLEDRARAALLQEEAFELEQSFEVFAADILAEGPEAAAAKPAKPAKPAEPARDKKQSATDRRLVLVVDDDDDVRESIGLLFEGNGYEVAVAENGARAIALLEQGLKPSVILLDLMMPVMSGWEFHKWQQARSAGAHPTIVFTATGLKPGSLGALPILSKTVDAHELLSAVDKLAPAPVAA